MIILEALLNAVIPSFTDKPLPQAAPLGDYTTQSGSGTTQISLLLINQTCSDLTFSFGLVLYFVLFLGRLQSRRYRHSPCGRGGERLHQARHLCPQHADRGCPRRQRRLQRQERLRQGHQEKLRCLNLQGQARRRRCRLHRPGDRAQPPRPGLQRLQPRARLPHRPHRLQGRSASFTRGLSFTLFISKQLRSLLCLYVYNVIITGLCDLMAEL